MIFNLEEVMKENDGQLIITHWNKDDSSFYKLAMTCKFGDLRVSDKSITDGIARLLNSYNILKNNDTTVEVRRF